MTLSCAVPQGLLPLLSSQGGAFRLSRGPPLGLSPPITWDSPPRWADESCSWTSSSDPGLPAGEGSPHLQLEMADYKLPTALPAPSPPTVAAPSSQLSGQKLGPPSLPTAHPALETACQPSHRTRPVVPRPVSLGQPLPRPLLPPGRDFWPQRPPVTLQDPSLWLFLGLQLWPRPQGLHPPFAQNSLPRGLLGASVSGSLGAWSSQDGRRPLCSHLLVLR